MQPEIFPWRDLILAVVALERIGELILSRRNTARLLAQGAVETGRGHYPALVAVHGAWFAAMIAFVPRDVAIVPSMLALYVLLQIPRAWILASLGPYWTTRIVSLKDAPLVQAGPYKFMRHPNYVLVIAEIVVLPLAFGAWWIAAPFGAINVVALAWRVEIEEEALRPRRRAG